MFLSVPRAVEPMLLSLAGIGADSSDKFLIDCSLVRAAVADDTAFQGPSLMRMGLHFGQAIFLLIAAGIAGVAERIGRWRQFHLLPGAVVHSSPRCGRQRDQHGCSVAGVGGQHRRLLRRLNAPSRVLVPLLVTSVAGGWAGALLLLKTPQHTFCASSPGCCWVALYCSLSAIRSARSPARRRSLMICGTYPGMRIL